MILFWERLTMIDIKNLDKEKTLFLIPLGATEQHGEHLPLGTDTLINQALIHSLKKQMTLEKRSYSLVILPFQSVGCSTEHTNFPGTLSLPAPLFLNLLEVLVEQIVSYGAQKIIFLNSHGGQGRIVDILIQHVRTVHRILAFGIFTYRLNIPKDIFSHNEYIYGIHGGAIESSLIAHAFPDLYQPCEKNYPNHLEKSHESYPEITQNTALRVGWNAEDLNPHGICGNLMETSAEKGAQMLQCMTAHLIKIINEIVSFSFR